MSKANKDRYWRRVRCGGCRYRCRYSVFRVFPGLRRGALFDVIHEQLVVDSDDSEKWKYRRRGTILGSLHAQKRAAWEHATDQCPNQGTGDAPPHDRLC